MAIYIEMEKVEAALSKVAAYRRAAMKATATEEIPEVLVKRHTRMSWDQDLEKEKKTSESTHLYISGQATAQMRVHREGRKLLERVHPKEKRQLKLKQTAPISIG